VNGATSSTDTTLSSGAVPVVAEGVRLVLEGVSKRWRRSDPPVLDGLRLEVPAATVVVVAGRNGAGKTTLLRIGAGIIAADAGSVELDGLAPWRNRRRYHQRIGFLSAGSAGLYARLTVAQHLAYWARLAFVPAGAREVRIAAALARFELEDIAERRADRLSMGQRQRLRLALALLHEPSLLLLDEPWNSLDGEGIELMNARILEFKAGGGIALVCVPSGHELATLPADRTYVLEGGRLESGADAAI
jgi:ABC-type multidrug transport system ATPase subunit